MRSPRTPPRLAERLLESRLEPETTEFVLGDLAEEFDRRRRAGSAARWWYWKQTLRCLARSLGQRAARAGALPGRSVPSLLGDGWWQDVASAGRGALRQPGLTAVITLTLALAIGANGAIFSLVDAVLIKPLPYPSPDSLVTIWELGPRGELADVAPANFLDWQQAATAFTEMAALTPVTLDLTDAGPPLRLEGSGVSARFFGVLAAKLQVGRGFVPEEDLYGGPKVAVISDGLWRRAFGADPMITDRQLMLNDELHTVVGVAPRGFDFPSRSVDIWVPLALSPEAQQQREAHFLTVVARMKGDVERPAAQLDMDRVAAQLAAAFPETNADDGANVVSLREDIVGDSRQLLMVLYAIVVIVLAVACANVANLLLARARFREKETAIRLALGASRFRVLRLALTEGLLYATLGTTIGVFGAESAVRGLRSLTVLGVPRLHAVALDWRVISYLAGAGLITGVCFSLAPAYGSRASAAALSVGSRVSRGAGLRLQGLLAVTQAALAVVCVVGALLLVHAFARLSRVDPGFDPSNVLTVDIAPRSERYAEREARYEFYGSVLARIVTLPGVESAAVTSFLPLTYGGGTISLGVEGRPDLEARAEERGLYVAYRVVSPDYFETLRVPVLRGTGFDATAIASNPNVAIVDQPTARRYFGGEDPIGKRVKPFSSRGPGEWLEIVGIVGATHHLGIGREPHPTLYVPHAQPHGRWVAPRALVVRTDGDPLLALPRVRAALDSIDPDLPVSKAQAFNDVVSTAVAPQRVIASLVGALGLLALSVASVGLYGVLAFLVSSRRHELGVRLAVGARPRDVMALVFERGFALLLAGLLLGGAAAWGLSRSLQALLPGVQPGEPSAWLAALAVVLCAGAAACYGPARRATRVDPLVTLRDG